jgi:hypothetical protein
LATTTSTRLIPCSASKRAASEAEVMAGSASSRRMGHSLLVGWIVPAKAEKRDGALVRAVAMTVALGRATRMVVRARPMPFWGVRGGVSDGCWIENR